MERCRSYMDSRIHVINYFGKCLMIVFLHIFHLNKPFRKLISVDLRFAFSMENILVLLLCAVLSLALFTSTFSFPSKPINYPSASHSLWC